MKIHIECNEKQAQIIQRALDLYTRIIMGQFDEVDKIHRWDCGNLDVNIDELKTACRILHDIYLPELHYGSYHGIYSPDLHDNAKVSYDIHQMLRYKISWHKFPEGGITVDFDSPMPASKEEFIKVEIKDGENSG